MKHEYKADVRLHVWTFGGSVPELTFYVPKIEWVAPETGAAETDSFNTVDDALAHGYKQKIADAGAIVRNTDTGKSATDAEKRAAMQAVADRLNSGQWNAERTGKRETKVTLIVVDALVEAIVAIRGRDVEAVRAYVESKAEDVRFALAMSDEFRMAYATAVTALKPAKKLDEDMAAELDGL